MTVEDVIFLGAGASASEGAPLQGNLFKEYFEYSRANPHEVEYDMNQSLNEFFRSFFGIDIRNDNLDETDFPTFEECLGILELALNRQESFKSYSLTPNSPKIQRVREDLIFLIAIILDRTLRGRARYHRDFIKRLQRERILKQTAFVSLNYDILIDNALMDSYRYIDVDYSVKFTNFEGQGDWSRPRPQRAVKLFKLHGSLNWLYCPTCISLTLTPKEKRVATLVFRPQHCEKCDSEMIPIVIPPTFFKVMSNYFLQQIWKQIEESVAQARRFFFCGYSFPDVDIHVKYLLKRIETNLGETPEVFVINNHEGKSEDQKITEELRYRRFFIDSSRVNYTDSSFQDFCEHGI
ncbi:hypothetical protein ES702_03875 [subsurface metagenome]